MSLVCGFFERHGRIAIHCPPMTAPCSTHTYCMGGSMYILGLPGTLLQHFMACTSPVSAASSPSKESEIAAGKQQACPQGAECWFSACGCGKAHEQLIKMQENRAHHNQAAHNGSTVGT